MRPNATEVAFNGSSVFSGNVAKLQGGAIALQSGSLLLQVRLVNLTLIHERVLSSRHALPSRGCRHAGEEREWVPAVSNIDVHAGRQRA